MKFSDVSPLAGIATGEGMMGKLTSLGGLGAIAKLARDDEEKKKKQEASGMAPTGAGMKKGGAVSASRRADGIAQRGKTRGKMV
jgi:hypothetical protein